MDKPEALQLAEAMSFAFPGNLGIDKAAAELRRLHAENASLDAALASSCDEQRHDLWESGGVAGCERARVAERQRDVLLEALKDIGKYTGEGSMYTTPWQDIVRSIGEKARVAIKAVEETK